MHGHAGKLPWDTTSIGPHANLYMLCTACFFNLYTDFVGSNNNKYMFYRPFTILFTLVVV